MATRFFDLQTINPNLRGIGSTPFTANPYTVPRTGTGAASGGAPSVTNPLTGFSTGPNQFRGQTAGGSVSSVSPGPAARQGVQISEFGRGDFDAALVDWNRVYQDAQQGIPQALELIKRFAPGGDFGLGQRQEASQLIGEGVARDTAAAVASGLSSTSSARGLNVLAGRERATAFANIADQAAQLELGATSLYQQMLSTLAQVGTSRPTPGQFISRITTPSGAVSGTTIKRVS